MSRPEAEKRHQREVMQAYAEGRLPPVGELLPPPPARVPLRRAEMRVYVFFAALMLATAVLIWSLL